MIRAETFVKRLTQEKIISREFADGLLERLAQSSQTVPADLFAKRLVERGVITQAICDHILELLEHAEQAKKARKAKVEKKTPPTSSPFDEIEEEPGPSLTADDPFGPPSESESKNQIDESTVPAVFRSKRTKFKKTAANPWDSKLLLYGIAGIVIMFVLGITLFYAIYRRGAEEYLNAANAARDSGNYTEAIKEYEDYIKFFPNHTQINEATIRLSLSKMRLITDSKSDWSRALSIAKEEIAKIVLQPDYRPEAEPEFTAILPTIAENLANGAKSKKDAKLLAEAEEAMLLVQKHVPLSAQPVDRLHRIQVDIDFTKREIAKDERLVAVAKEVENLLQQPSQESNAVASAYEKTVALQTEYAGIEKDDRFLEILQNIARNENRGIRFESGEQYTAHSSPAADPGAEKVEAIKDYVILADRKAQTDSATRSERTLFVYANGTVFALRSTDGKILWKKTIGGSAWTVDNSPTVFPVSVAADNPAGSQEEAFLIDYRTWELLRMDAQTGNIRFHCRIGEPFRLMDIPSNRAISSIFLATYSGQCFQIDANSGKVLGVVRFPQTTNVAPLVDFENNRLIQIAHRTSLYLYPLQRNSGELLFDAAAKAESLYLGHLPGTIRTTPFFFGPYLLVARQSQPNDSELCIYELKKGGQSNENSENNNDAEKANGYSLSLVQTIPLQGKIDTPPLIDGKQLFLATDSGRVALFVLNDAPAASSASQPIQLIAETASTTTAATNTAPTTQRMWDSSRYLGLFDGHLWVSDNELTAFEVQQSRKRLVSIRKSDPMTPTIAPLRRIDDTVFRMFRYRGQNAVAVKALALADGKTLWETLLAVPCVQEPTYNAETKMLRCVTETGKLYEIPAEKTNSGLLVVDKPFANLGGERRGSPIRFLIPLANSMEAWIERDLLSKTIPIFDPLPNNPRQFRFIPMNEKMQADPIAFGTGLLVPLSNGKITLFDPQTGGMLADPFFVKLSPTDVSQWSTPLNVTGGTRPTFLILDQRQQTLYRVVAERNTGGTRKIKLSIVSQTSVSDLDRERDSNQIVQIGEIALIFSLKKGTAQEVQLDPTTLEMRLGKIHDFTAEIVWGPFHDDGFIFFATSEHRLHILSIKDGAISEQKKAVPDFSLIGRPFVSGNQSWFLSSGGALWTVNLDNVSDTNAPLRETGIPAVSGPIRFENRFCVPGKDGCLYFFE